MNKFDLGAVTAYAMAVEKGYEGTEEEFAALLANSGNNAVRAEAGADRAQQVLDSIPLDFQEVSQGVATLTKEIATLDIVSKNRFNKADPEIVKGQIIAADGQWISEQDFCESGYIPCDSGDAIRYSHWRDGQRFDMNAMWIAFFDGNKNFVNSTIYGDDLVAIAPCDGYFRTSFYAARYDTTMVTINMEMPAEYEPYFAIRKTVDALAQNAEMSGGLQWKGKKWYAYGTSLTSAEIGKYVPYVEALSGLVATNKGIGGGALVANRNIYNALMDNTDGKADADLITIEVGANDYSSPLGNVSSMDTSTFCGALNTCLKNVLKNCPKAQVVLMCSTRQPTNDDGLTLSALDGKNPYGVTYEERDETIRRVAAANGIYYIPFGSGLGMGLFRMQASGIYNVDHIHHTDLGGYNLAQGVWSYLRNIPLWYNALPNS